MQQTQQPMMAYQNDGSNVRATFNAQTQIFQMQQQQLRQQAPLVGGGQMMNVVGAVAQMQQSMPSQAVRQPARPTGQVMRPPVIASMQTRPLGQMASQNMSQFMNNQSAAPQRMVGMMRLPGDHGLHLRIPVNGGTMVQPGDDVTPLTPQDQLSRYVENL